MLQFNIFLEAILFSINCIVRLKASINATDLLDQTVNNAIYSLYEILNEKFKILFIKNLIVSLSRNFCFLKILPISIFKASARGKFLLTLVVRC